ncbi:WD40 repeat domain-containing serine/threonine-protein kinase [Tuwongella immobilis]|uniref:Protein kinase domain-containing protein n=1 Tax=Tuwongella immobilis TaxID=692036 RepID=A0A6C2YMK3_9BACT|nr:protein kinase [Tuwongella immobilis]VIP02828.1 serine threonine protein kinase : Serine/threonine protein kinase OS=Singulisphaera acidiphila (strain ATCC BAA-1392 / DSM 18658 / VKM B-2454 / MOB10) GN=Sinac_2851 PE=3 SV=1: Pkinase: WD40: WD40 [Tuwongella immobilis]VTS02572.1 serine threonine protein kinase : Serine/threonine protein kinase OS=Singulisphaera acidiphila (strain ATCC BAA-1392 / DSM 18658 / VKM B-2454 / MOB10) GN=Sinac_2851 PE=3 SV=1: Pkinase: WD40: WD40 [Tuwongella immobilis]
MTDPRAVPPNPPPSGEQPTIRNLFAESPASRKPPQVVGNYRLMERIGEGGMGQVFRGEHVKLGRIVAIKLIHPELLQTPRLVKRFVREVRAAARVDHPLIVRAYDAESDGNIHYLVMEWIDGQDLKSIVARRGPLPVPEVLRIALEVALALDHLHQLGMVHRDLKPSNLIQVRTTGQVKLLDLGLARLTEHDGPVDTSQTQTMTRQGDILGTPDFMAPEQAMNAKDVDIRADLYSLGCTLYYLLTASVPFPGGNTIEKLLRQWHEPPPDLRRFRPDVPEPVAALVSQLMAKSLEHRFATPRVVVDALRSLASRPVPLAMPVEDATIPQVEPVEAVWQQQFSDWVESDSTLEEATRATKQATRPKRRSIAWLAASGMAAAALAVLVMLFLNPAPTPNPTDESANSSANAKESADALERDRWYAVIDRQHGTPEAIAAAENLRKLVSPLTLLPRNGANGPHIRIGEANRRHGGWIRGIAASADGERIVTGGWDRIVRIWNRQPWKLRETRSGHDTPIWNVAISPNGRWVAGISGFDTLFDGDVGMERSLRLWDLVEGGEREVFDNMRYGWSVSAAFTPDSKRLLVGQYDSAMLWDLEKSEPVRHFRTDGMNWCMATAVSPDGKFAFTGGGFRDHIRVWELDTGKLVRAFSKSHGPPRCLAIADDGRRLAECSDGTVRVWDWTTGTMLREFRIPNLEMNGVTWCDAGQCLAIVRADGRVVWTAADTGEVLRETQIDGVELTGVTRLGNHGQIAVSASDGGVRRFQSETGTELEPLPAQSIARQLNWLDGDRQLLLIRELGVTEFRPLLPTRAVPAALPSDWRTVAALDDGSEWLGRTNATWQLRNPFTGTVQATVEWREAGQARLATLVPNPASANQRSNGVVAYWPNPRELRYQPWKGPMQIWPMPQQEHARALAVSANGQMLAYGTDRGQVELIALAEPKPRFRVKIDREPIRKLAFTPDGQTVVVLSGNSQVYTLYVTTEAVKPIPNLEGSFDAVAISADGTRLAVGSLVGEVRIHGLLSPGRSRRWSFPSAVRSLRFSRDGAMIAVGLANGCVEIERD